MKLINNLGYIRGVTPMAEADKKHLKYRIDIQLLIKTRSREKIKTILVSFRSFKFYSIFNLCACDVYVLLIIMKNAWVIKNSTNILGREYGWSERMLS